VTGRGGCNLAVGWRSLLKIDGKPMPLTYRCARRVPDSDRFKLGGAGESASHTSCPSQGTSGNRCFPPDDASMEISGLRGQTAEKSRVVLERAG